MATWIPGSVSRSPAAGPFGLGAALLREPAAAIGLALVLAYVLIAIVVPWLPLRDPLAISSQRLIGPTPDHPFGTDALGRDLLSRILFGARLSVQVAVLSVAIATLVGGALGLAAGYLGGVADLVTGRVMDVFFAFPPILLAIGIAAVLGAGPGTAVVAIAVVYAPLFFRLVRGSVLAESAEVYVEAAEALGVDRRAILFRHILPNVVSPIVVQTAVCLSYGILIESALSYLGVGVQPPTPSWGTILNEGKEFLALAPWVSLFPGGFIMLSVLAFNVVGDGLRDALDPRMGGAA
jgi:peptide/nickel transport system permease protein